MTAAADSVPGTAPRRAHRISWHRVLSGVIALAVIVAVFGFAFPKFAGYAAAWDAISRMAVWEAAVLCLVAGLRLVVPVFQLQAALPGLRFGHGFAVYTWGTAMSNTVPAGGAIGIGVTYEMLLSWGSTAAAITREIIVTGIWNDFVILALPVIAVGLNAVTGSSGGESIGLALVGLVVLVVAVVAFAVILRSRRIARHVGDFAARAVSSVLHWFHRNPVRGWGDALVRFDEDTEDLIVKRWVPLSVSTAGVQLCQYLLLLLCLRFVGIPADEANAIDVFGAYVFSRLLQLVPITPGGLGVVQLGLAAALASTGAPNDEIAAATLVYTALTWFPPIPFGIGSFLVWRRGRAKKAGGATATTGAGAPGPGAGTGAEAVRGATAEG